MIKLDSTAGTKTAGPTVHPTATGDNFKIIQRPTKGLTEPTPIYIIK